MGISDLRGTIDQVETVRFFEQSDSPYGRPEMLDAGRATGDSWSIAGADALNVGVVALGEADR